MHEALPWILDVALLALGLMWIVRVARLRVREATEAVGPAYLEITSQGTVIHRVHLGQPVFRVSLGLGLAIVLWTSCLIISVGLGCLGGTFLLESIENANHLELTSIAFGLGLAALFPLPPLCLAWWLQSQRLEVFERGLIRRSWCGVRQTVWFVELGGITYVSPLDTQPGWFSLRSAADTDQPPMVWLIRRADTRLNDLIEWLLEQTYQRMVEQFRRDGRADWTDWLQFRSDGLAVWKKPRLGLGLGRGWLGDCRSQPPRVIAYDRLRLQQRARRGDWEILELPANSTTTLKPEEANSTSAAGKRVCILSARLENFHPAIVFLQERREGLPLRERDGSEPTEGAEDSPVIDDGAKPEALD